MSTTTKKPQQSGPLTQALLILLFGAVLGSVFVCRDYFSGPAPADTVKLDVNEAVRKYGCSYTEVSKQCKIDFTHQAPVLDKKLEHIMPLVASTGASVSVVDYNRDGLPDLYVVNSGNGTKNALFRNNGDGTFTNVADELGVADLNQVDKTGVCQGAIWADVDNDGFEDLFVYRWGRPELFLNNKGKGFTRVTDTAGLPRWLNANSAVWLDYNRDGFIDLFIAGYWPDEVNLWKLETTEIMPDSFQYAKNGGRKYLLRNRGKDSSGKWQGFEDVTAKVGIRGFGWALSVAAADLRGTGYPDIVIANDYGVNEFLANKEGKEFVGMGKETRIGDQSKSGMSVCFGDVFNLGRLAIYVTNISEPGILLQGNNLWVPEPGRAGDELRYQNQARVLGVEMGGWSWGAQFGDLNNDGRLDLILTNGYISTGSRTDYWYDYSRIAGALSNIIADAAKWPPMRGQSLAGGQRHCLWLNRGGSFTDVAAAIGFRDIHDGRSLALVDLWNRGMLDVVEATQKGPLLVYKNTVAPENGWIQFELEGTRSNRSAIGARVRVYWDNKVQLQEVSGGSGYAGQNMRRLHFGLGKDARVDRVVINWPTGQTQTLASPKAGILHKIVEPQ